MPRPDDLQFTAHAARQMARRAISGAEVVEALGAPETTYSSPEHPERTVVLGRTTAGRRLKLVVRSGHPTLVITAADRDQVP